MVLLVRIIRPIEIDQVLSGLESIGYRVCTI